jgi:hypothetical protein
MVISRPDEHMKSFLILICACIFACGNVFAQKIDSTSLTSIVEALQYQVLKYPSVFPLESYDGGIQPLEKGLRQAYFGYGERRFIDRFDFHPAMDLGYFPTETGYVTTEQGQSEKVRAPQTYLKKVYAIQKGELVSIALISTGYKLVLKHTLERPYHDNEGNSYYHYYTCYRHLDSRSLAYLDEIARTFTGDPEAGYEQLFGKYLFEAGEQIALVGYAPNIGPDIPRAHLDFSLNLFGDPNKGGNIRNHALNPLFLFPPFEYADPQSHVLDASGVPAYKILVNESAIVAPGKGTDGQFTVRIPCGGQTADAEFSVCRYFALNALDVSIYNDGKPLETYHLDRHRKLGYNTGSYESLDTPNTTEPHFLAPLREQDDVYEMTVVLPVSWFKKIKYDWSETGLVSIELSSIWHGYLEGHELAFTIPLPAADTDN